MMSDYPGNHARRGLPVVTGVDRRAVLRGGGAVALSGLIAALLGGAKPARAQAISGGVPEVDRATIRVVTDSYYVSLATGGKVGDVEVGRTPSPLTDRPPEKALQSEFGLSLHLETQRGNETRNVLIDFGYTPATLLNNLAILGIDPAKLDAMVLSHGHYDHFGGMVGFLKATQGRRKAKLPFYVGGEECFCSRQQVRVGQAPVNFGAQDNQATAVAKSAATTAQGPEPAAHNFGALDRQAIAAADLLLTIAESPALIAGHAFVSGQIQQGTFERTLAPTRMKVGIDNGLGCFPDKMPADRRPVDWAPDNFSHEISTCVNVKGRGLVVTTSCGHRGIVNSTRRAMAVSGVKKVHAVVGGFHLLPHKEDYVRQTIKELVDLGVDYVIPMHCSGEPFYEIMKAELPNKLIRSYTGTKLVFGA